MESNALKRMLKDFPFLWAINQKWVYEITNIKARTVDDEFIKMLLKAPADENILLWVKSSSNEPRQYGKFDELRKIKPYFKNESFAQRLFYLPANQKIDFLIIAQGINVLDTEKAHIFTIANITIYRPPKGRNYPQILHNLKEGKIKW